MAHKGHTLDLMLATVAGLGLAIALSVQTASAMDVPAPDSAPIPVLAP